MKDKILSRITSIIAILLLVISVVLVGLIYLGPSGEAITSAGGDTVNVPQYTEGLLLWVYALLILTAALTLIFATAKFVKTLIVTPKSAIKTLIPMVAFALIFVVAWNLGSPEKMSILGYEGNQNEGFWVQLTDMTIYTIYALFGLILLAIAGGGIYSKLK